MLMTHFFSLLNSSKPWYWLGGISPVVGILTGCQPEPPTKTDTAITQVAQASVSKSVPKLNNATTPTADPEQPVLASQPTVEKVAPSSVLDKLKKPPATDTTTIQLAEQSGQAVAERLAVSYARASAYTSNQCPKLVEFQFSNQSITRQDERFPTQTCDYFIYLRKGESLTIDVSPEVKAELISPINFNFANGSYLAPAYDKYTVRLSYDGTRFRPQDFKYDVILTKKKGEVAL